jgi:hypothetical protein
MRIFVVVCALALAGCGAAKVDPRVDARAEYQKSLEEYQTCIDMSFKNVQKCEGNRVLMESNWRAYDNVTAGIKKSTNAVATSQGANTAGATQGTNIANAAQATSLPPPVATSAVPQTTSSLPARIPPAAQETTIEDHPEAVDMRSTPTGNSLVVHPASNGVTP